MKKYVNNKNKAGIMQGLLIFCVSTCAVFPAYAMGLRENSVVTDSSIKLGDIFYGLEKDEDKVLGVAPAPGQELVLDANTLLRIAVALDLSWRPTRSNETITLRRQATIIEQDAIQAALKEKLAEENVSDNFMVKLPVEYQKIILPYDQPATLEVTDLKLDSDKKMFTAMISAPSADNPIQKFAINGAIEPVIKVPALVENLQNGRVIQESDIEMIEISEKDYSRDLFMDAQQLVGLTARRMILGGRPIHTTELISPQIVGRGDIVTLSLNDGVLNLTTQAKALENGAIGDMIRVVNTASNQTLQAQVTGERAVQIISN